MKNQLSKNPARFLRTDFGQPYYPAIPARDGFWRDVWETQFAWVNAKIIIGKPLEHHWSLEILWFDPYKGLNLSWYGQAMEYSPINSPYLTRRYDGKDQIRVEATPKRTRIWVPPEPYLPEQPYIPDRHVFEDLSGWDAGARGVVPVRPHDVAHFSISPTARGVVVGLSRTAAAGAYWKYLIGVYAEDSVAKVYAQGEEVAHLGRFTISTKFRIAYTEAAFEVFVGDALRYSGAVPPDKPNLIYDVSLYKSGDFIFDPAITSHQIGSVNGRLPRLKGIAFGDGLEDGAYMVADDLDGFARGEGQANDQAHGQLYPLMGLATDLDDLSFTTGSLARLQGSALGYRDLPPEEDPSLMFVDFPKITARDAPTDLGVVGFQAPVLQGISSDEEEISMAYGVMQQPHLYIEEENAIEDELTQGAKGRDTYTKNLVREAALIQRAVLRWTTGQSSLTDAILYEQAVAQSGFAVSQISGAVMQVIASLTSSDGNSLPSDDQGVLLTTCHESGGFVTHYSGYNFQSFAQIGGRYYGVAADGVYLLEGEADAGQAIDAVIDFGVQRFSSAAELKGVPAMYAGIASHGPAALVVGTRQGEYRYLQRGTSPRLQIQRFDLGRGLRDTHYDIGLEVPAQGFELESLEFDVAKSTRKV